MQTEAQQLSKPVAGWRRWWPITHLSYVWLIIAIVHCALMKDTSDWNRSDVLVWDAGGYYLYLPSAFITNDLGDGSYVAYIRQQYRPDLNPDYSLVHLPNGKAVFKYPIGMSIMYAPWFAAAHAYAAVTGYPMDGYSKPYQRNIALGRTATVNGR